MGIHTEAVQKLYVAYFSRPADTAGLTYWEGVVAANGGSTAAVSTAFAASKEYTDTFAGQSQYQVVNTVYMNLFGRAAEPAALAFWGQALVRGDVTIAGAVTTIAGAAQGTDATFYGNKVKAATAFTEALDTSAEILGYTGTGANLAAKTFLAGITTDASLTTAIVPSTLNSSIATVIQTGSSSTGQSFSLTSTIGEQVNGTAGSDVFTAVVDTNGTFNTGDTINGLGGQDTLNLLLTGASALPVGATVSNVEIINMTYAATGAGTTPALNLNSANFAGVQQMWQIDNITGSNFQGVTVGAGVTAGFRSTGMTASAVQANATVTAAAGVTSVAVALDGVASGSTITLAESGAGELSTVSVSGSVAMDAGTPAGTGTPATPAVDPVSTLTLAGGTDIDTLNLSLTSSSTVVITALDDLNTFDASGSTGNLTVNLNTPDELRSATFGSGNDIVTLSLASLAVTGTATTGTLAINLGAGNDVLNLSAVGNAAPIATTITLGAGNDTLAITGLTNLTAVNAAGITNDMITVADFAIAQDVLDISALGPRDVLVNTELANIAAATDFAAALALVASATTVGQYSVFNFGGDAYVFNNAATDGLNAGDGLLKITGVAAEALTGSNFVA
jgi:hypothetical protein